MLPVLYSFRRCPYAIRARMALSCAGQSVELREVLLSNKPASMMRVSPKGTVPVLVLNNENVLEESLDIMLWALGLNDPEYWLGHRDSILAQAIVLIDRNDNYFKLHLDKYKYAERGQVSKDEYHRGLAEEFLLELEERLKRNNYLLGEQNSLADIALFPFVRQFAFVDKPWFDRSPYPKLQQWLANNLESELFIRVMKKYPVWQSGDALTLFPD